MTEWLPRLVARVPATVHAELLVAFLAIVGLLIAVGLRVLGDVNRRAEDVVKLQRKIAAYRQLQHDTTGQLYSVASALLVPDERTLDGTLRQLNQFGYDLDRLQFVAKDEVESTGVPGPPRRPCDARAGRFDDTLPSTRGGPEAHRGAGGRGRGARQVPSDSYVLRSVTGSAHPPAPAPTVGLSARASSQSSG